MLKIIERNVEVVGHFVDFKLENGILLYDMDWNGEEFRNGYDEINKMHTNRNYRPVYRFQEENISLDNIKDDPDYWDYALEILGFNEF